MSIHGGKRLKNSKTLWKEMKQIINELTHPLLYNLLHFVYQFQIISHLLQYFVMHISHMEHNVLTFSQTSLCFYVLAE